MAANAHVRGQILAGLTYVGGNGGITIPGGTGTAGGKEGPPISRPWISLSDLGDGDQMVYTGRGATDGTFDIANVPDGTYQLTAWDDEQEYILFSFNVTVDNHVDVDTGKNYLSGWMARIYGSVFIDTNENGIRDTGEQGVPGTAVTLRERDNSLMDQFTNAVTTNSNGDYSFKEAYPLTRWVILEHFNTRYEGTGVTVQGENDPAPTTFVGGAVDINVLPVLGLGGRVDWGVKPYAPGTNGGIVGTVSYDVTRNELDPAYSVAEDYQPGIPNINVHLYGLLRNTDPTSPDFGLPLLDARGLEQKGPELAETVHLGDVVRAQGLPGPAVGRHPAHRSDLHPDRWARREQDLRRVAGHGLPGTAVGHDPRRLGPDGERQLRVRDLRPEPVPPGRPGQPGVPGRLRGGSRHASARPSSSAALRVTTTCRSTPSWRTTGSTRRHSRPTTTSSPSRSRTTPWAAGRCTRSRASRTSTSSPATPTCRRRTSRSRTTR